MLQKLLSQAGVLSGLMSAQAPSSLPAVELVYQFPLTDRGTAILDNLAAGSDGSLLLTTVTNSTVYLLDPSAPTPSPEPLYSFPDANTTKGAVETAPGVFAVIVGNETEVPYYKGVPGTWTVWTLEVPYDSPSSAPPNATKIADLPEAETLQSMTDVQGSPNVVLLADDTRGLVWRVDLATGEHGIAAESPLFLPADSSKVPYGVNGLRTLGGFLYFTSSAQGIYGRMPITDDGFAAGEAEVLAVTESSRKVAMDGFDMDSQRTAWITYHPDMVLKIAREGGKRNITAAEDTDRIRSPDSAAFGKGCDRDRQTLYVTTSGHNGEVGGQVFAVRTWLV